MGMEEGGKGKIKIIITIAYIIECYKNKQVKR
jgi:hypothetical protein